MTAVLMTRTARLGARRQPLQRWALAATPLGGLCHGAAAQPAALADDTGVPLLFGSEPIVDGWITGAAARSGRTGHVRWRHDGRWMYGAIDIDEDDRPLQEVAEHAYRELFASLAETGCANLLRAWNYVPRINEESGGLERYRQFNVGRQQAFLLAHRSAFEGAPAACAIGTGGGPLRVRFLGGRVAPLAIENPRQVSAYRYPPLYGPRSPTFSRAVLFDAGADSVALLISGTASIVGHASVHAGDVRAQTRETLVNLGAVVAAANRLGRAHFDVASLACTVYVRHAGDAGAVRDELVAALGTRSTAVRDAIVAEGDICRRELLVEIEAHAFARGVQRT